MTKKIEIVAPDLKRANGTPAINNYPAGQTIGYINYTADGYPTSLYVRILDSIPKCVIPVLFADWEDMNIVNAAIEAADETSLDWVGKEQVPVTLTKFDYNEREECFMATILSQDDKENHL